MADNPPESYALEDFAEFASRITYHPAMGRLAESMGIQLPNELKVVFEFAAYRFNQREAAFKRVRETRGDEDARFSYEVLSFVQEGIRSTFYHLQRFVSMEEEVKLLGAQLARLKQPAAGMSLGVPSQSLVAEYESFTIMSRSTLDRLSRFLSYYLQTGRENLLRLIPKLEALGEDTDAKAVIAALQRHRTFLETQISLDKGKKQTERDRLVHSEYVPFATVNVMWLGDGSISVRAISPGESLDDAGIVLMERFAALSLTVIDVLLTVLDGEQVWRSIPRKRP